jgi:3D (Asp-Asp-Asp) domain-containing protein
MPSLKSLVPHPEALSKALAAALLVMAALLACGELLLARRSRPAAEAWRVQDLDQDPPPRVTGSRRLQKGWVIVLKEGAPERWRTLVRLRAGAAPEPVKRLKRLSRGRALELLKGTGSAPNPVWLPRATLCVRELTMTATGYDPGPVDAWRGHVGATSTGRQARFGVIAVDPRVLPYQTRLYVFGYGPGLAADTGGAIKGRRLDLCFDSTRQARAWGRQKVRALVLGWMPRSKARRALAAAGLPPE